MKITRIVLILAVLLCFISSSPVKGAVNVTAYITVTNAAGVGSNWVVNGNTRVWTNAAGTPPASWVTIGASAAATATNLYSHITRFPYLSPFLIIGRSSPTNFTLQGTSVQVTTGNYFTVTYVTNQGTNLNILQLPLENVVGATNRTNNAHWIVDAINRFAYTNKFETNTPAVSNLLGLGARPYQEVISPVGFRGRTSVNSNFFATNGFTKSLTNIDQVSSNAINFGAAIRSEGSGGNSLQVGSNALSVGSLSLAVGNNALASNASAMAVGNGAQATNDFSTAVGYLTVAGGSASVAVGSGANATASAAIAIGQDAEASAANSINIGSGTSSGIGSIAIGGDATKNSAMAIGFQSSATHSNSTAFGQPDVGGNAVTTTDTNQVRIGTALNRISFPGLLESPKNTNSQFAGTNIARGSWSFPRFDLTTLAAGNNISVPLGTNRFVRLGAGPVSAATICGMIGAATSGGLDGQNVWIFNDTGFAVTFAVNTVDPVAANRLNTAGGSNVSIDDQGWSEWIYDGTDSRWKLVGTYPVNANVSVSGTASSANVIGYGFTNMIWGQSLFVDSSGNDSTAIRGDASKPWQRVDIAATNGQPGDVVLVRAGSNWIGTNCIKLPHGVSLIGEGKGVSRIYSTAQTITNGCIVIPGSRSAIGRLTIAASDSTRSNYYQCPIGSVGYATNHQAFTNSLWFDLELIGGADSGFVDEAASCYWTMRSCDFYSFIDGFASIGNTSPGRVPHYMDMADCNFYNIGPTPPNLPVPNSMSAFVWSYGTATVNRCYFKSRGGPGVIANDVRGIYFLADTTLAEGHIFIANSTVSATISNGTLGTLLFNTSAGFGHTNIEAYNVTLDRGSASGVLDANGVLYSGPYLAGSPANAQVITAIGTTGTYGWSNPIAFISTPIRIGTNISVGVNNGIEGYNTLETNASFAFVFTGTTLNGEGNYLSVSNFSASTIYATNTAGIYDPSVASNVTTFAIMGSSRRIFHFKADTNSNLGVIRWCLMDGAQKGMELGVAGQSLVEMTNAAGSIVTVSNAYSSAVQTVSGAGNGFTNYLITLSTNSINDFYLGSSNVNIYTVGGGNLGTPVYWNASITNRSANNWGFRFDPGTNYVEWSGVYGTNPPSVLTNGTKLFISGRSDGSNTVCGYTYYAPGK